METICSCTVSFFVWKNEVQKSTAPSVGVGRTDGGILDREAGTAFMSRQRQVSKQRGGVLCYLVQLPITSGAFWHVASRHSCSILDSRLNSTNRNLAEPYMCATVVEEYSN